MKKTTCTLLAAALTVGVSVPILVAKDTPSASSLREGLVLHFTFDEAPAAGSVADTSGAGNRGQVFGAQWTPSGKRGGAMQFTSSNQYIRVPNAESLNPSSLTLSAWIKTSRNDDTWRRIFDKSWTNGYSLSIGGGHTAENKYKGKVVAEIGAKVPGVKGLTCSDQALTDGGWHHVVVTHRGGEECCYVDGVKQQRVSRGEGGVPANTFDLTIGINLVDPNPAYDEVGSSFDGLIDEPMIYNRALTAEEVKVLFDSQR